MTDRGRHRQTEGWARGEVVAGEAGTHKGCDYGGATHRADEAGTQYSGATHRVSAPVLEFASSVPVPLGRPVTVDSSPTAGARAGARRYIAGNATALLAGLVSAYFALTHGTDVSIRIHDFMEYYSASHLLLAGHGGQIYDFPTLGHLQQSLAAPLWPGNSVLPYLYPPYFAVALAPLAALPYGIAFVLWLALNCVLFFAVTWSIERYAGLSGRQALLFRLGSVCSLPVFMTLGLGQVSIVLVALFTAVFFLARAGRDGLAGLALACALIKPAYVVPFLLVFLVRRSWRVLTSFGLSAAALCLLAVPFCGLSIDLTYARTLLDVSSWQGKAGDIAIQHVVVAPATYAAAWNHSVAGFAQLLLSPSAASLTTILFAGTALVLLAYLSRTAAQLDLPLAIAAVVALLISPHTLAYDLTILLLPIGVAVRYRGAFPRWPGWCLGVLLFVASVLIAVGYRLVFAVPVQLSVIVMISLAAWLALAISHQPSEITSDLAPRRPHL